MKREIAVLSDCRMPTLPVGGHGLGRMAWDIADGLRRRGHEVTLWAGPGSKAPDGVEMNVHDTERERLGAIDALHPQIIIDLSHDHDLSQRWPDAPVLNWLVDLECEADLPNTVVGNTWQQKLRPKARIVPLGIDVDALPELTPGREKYLAYAAKIHPAKGFDLALRVHESQSIPVWFVGQRFVDAWLPRWQEQLVGEGFHLFVGKAWGLLSPSRVDAGGRVNLEAAALGTPTLCLDLTGTACHVEHCVSGFVCQDVQEMIEAVGDLGALNTPEARRKMREWVRETHDIGVMLDGLERLADAVADGETW